MTAKRIVFLAIVTGLIGLMAATSGYLIKHTRIGLEFRGGYELNFAAEPLTPGGEVTLAQVRAAGEILAARANKLGTGEPAVNILGTTGIRLIVAGINAGDPLIAALHDQNGLPVKLVETYSESVGGVLGAKDLADTLGAAGIALGLIFLFLIAVYRGPGLIAVFTVVATVWTLLIAFNALGSTLSLAAIVAYVLGVGIASDANILSFERIRDELDAGHPVGASVLAGGRKALLTIADSNATVAICAVILLLAGIGPILGFALTTLLGLGLGFLVNVVFARCMFWLWYGERTDVTRLFGRPLVRAGVNSIDYVRIGTVAMIAALAFSAYGAFALATRPLNLDIEFKAGTALDIKIGKPITQGDATDLIFGSGAAPATVAIGGANQDTIAIRFDDVLDTAKVNSVVDQFKTVYGPGTSFAENTADPGVARHLAAQSVWVVLLALAGTAVFILIRFGWRYAVASMLTMLVSAWFVMSSFAVFFLEIDITFIAAMLTVIGYTLNNAIVVFDRIRENLRHEPVNTAAGLKALVNRSIAQVGRRSIFTALTVMAGALCLYQFGAEPLQMFSLAIFLGLACGTVTSLLIAPVAWTWLRPEAGATSQAIIEAPAAA